MVTILDRHATGAIRASLAALGILLAAPVMASGLTCTASEQCRGDAVAMCAPSSLQLEIKTGANGSKALWIDRQGPYKARAGRHEGKQVWTLEAFGGDHVLEIEETGQFLYTGNRGKRFSGTCKEIS